MSATEIDVCYKCRNCGGAFHKRWAVFSIKREEAARNPAKMVQMILEDKRMESVPHHCDTATATQGIADVINFTVL